MLIGAAFLVCLMTIPLARGRLSSIAELSLRHAWLLPAAFAIQLTIVYLIPHWPHSVLDLAHMATYGLAAAFAAFNWRVPGLLVVAAGGLSNFIAISANGGVMPASPSALATAGLSDTPGQFASSISVPDPHLLFLGDIFAVPASWPVSNVYSVGDVMIVFGAFVMLHAASGSRLARFVRRPAPQAG